MVKDKILLIFRKIIKRLPSSYPHPIIVIYKYRKCFEKKYWIDTKYDKDDPNFKSDIFCYMNYNIIYVSYRLNKKHKNIILNYLLHEIGHLYFSTHYRSNDKRWNNYRDLEAYANKFASRWCIKFKKEKII